MEKERKEDYFVREDLVSNQHVHHESEEKERKREEIVFTGAILRDITPKPRVARNYEKSDYFLG